MAESPGNFYNGVDTTDEHTMNNSPKETFRRLLRPVLQPFEKGDGPFAYRPLNRKILVAVGSLFLALAAAVAVIAPKDGFGFLLPVVVFGGVGFVALVVGLLGTDRAVSNIWGNK